MTIFAVILLILSFLGASVNLFKGTLDLYNIAILTFMVLFLMGS